MIDSSEDAAIVAPPSEAVEFTADATAVAAGGAVDSSGAPGALQLASRRAAVATPS
jgi:hypothetical protein